MSVKEILKNIGLVSQETVLADIERYMQSQDIPSQEAIEMLSPDNIDSGEFWEESVKINPLCICGDRRVLGKPIDSVKYFNRMFFESLGVNNCYNMMKVSWKNFRVLEIGPGYGQMKDFYERNGDTYEAIDVNPLFDGCLKGDGSSIPDKEYDFVVSSNVFQHLSVNQRRSYYRSIQKNLSSKGFFSFTTAITDTSKRLYNGKGYMYTTGQFTELQYLTEVFEDLREVGLEITSYTMGLYSSAIHTRKVC